MPQYFHLSSSLSQFYISRVSELVLASKCYVLYFCQVSDIFPSFTKGRQHFAMIHTSFCLQLVIMFSDTAHLCVISSGKIYRTSGLHSCAASVSYLSCCLLFSDVKSLFLRLAMSLASHMLVLLMLTCSLDIIRAAWSQSELLWNVICLITFEIAGSYL